MFEREMMEVEGRLKTARQMMDDPKRADKVNSMGFKVTMAEMEDRKKFYESAKKCLEHAFEYANEDGVKALSICLDWFDGVFSSKNLWHVRPKGKKSFRDNVWLKEVGLDEERMEPLTNAISAFEDQKAFSDAELLKERLRTLVAEMVKLVIDVRKEYVTK